MSAVNYLWNPINDNIVKEFDDAGNTIADYTTKPGLYGDLISQHRDGQSSFYHYDGQGSTTSLTDTGGNVTDTNAYSAFGEVTEHTGSTANPFQFVGQKQYYRDAETGDYEVRRRPFSRERGRWFALDSIERSLANLSGLFSSYVYSHNNCISLSDPSGYWPLCQGKMCMNTFFGNKEGIYGLKVDVVAGNSSICGPGGPKIEFTYIETHLPPPGAPGGVNPETGMPSPCLEPANWELSQASLTKWKFGRITDRNCSVPVVVHSKSKPGGCITISISWTCDTVCERDNGCICGPRLPWMGIYSPWWDPHGLKGAGAGILPEAILTQANISYEEAGSSCGLTGCRASALLFKLNNFTMGPLPGHDRPNQPGDVKRDPIDPSRKWEPGDFFFIGIPPTSGCTAAEENHLWGQRP